MVDAGARSLPDPDHRAPARRPGLLAAEFRQAMSVGWMTTSELATVLAVVVLGLVASLLQPPVPAIVAAIVFVAITTPIAGWAALRAIPPRVRRGVETVSFVGAWERRRARAMGIDSIPTKPDAARRWLETYPERPVDRWFRIEVLLVAGRVEEAAEVASRLPVDTPWERFERVLNDDWIAWSGGGDGDPAAVREAAEAVGPDGDEARLRAEVSATIMEARRLASNGGDPVGLLAATRAQLGHHPDARLPPELRRRAFTAALLAAIFVAILVYLDPLARFFADVVG